MIDDACDDIQKNALRAAKDELEDLREELKKMEKIQRRMAKLKAFITLGEALFVESSAADCLISRSDRATVQRIEPDPETDPDTGSKATPEPASLPAAEPVHESLSASSQVSPDSSVRHMIRKRLANYT
jgi:hypothetical protein